MDHHTPGRSTPQPEQDDAEATMIAEPSPAHHHREFSHPGEPSTSETKRYPSRIRKAADRYKATQRLTFKETAVDCSKDYFDYY